MRLWTRGGAARGGSNILPRHTVGQVNWPRCARCRRCVDAYGLENETDSKIELWAICYGVRLDPTTGLLVHGAPRVHEKMKDSVIIQKGPGWSLQRLTDSISRMTFFDPEGSRRWEQDLTPEGIH